MNLKNLPFRLLGTWYNLGALVAPTRTGQRLLRLFATPPRPRIRPKEQRFLDQARLDRDTLREWGGVVYHWDHPGQGHPAQGHPEQGHSRENNTDHPYVLLSYGWGYNAGRWRHYVPQLLEAGYRVVAYDPPGHGHASANTLVLPQNIKIVRHLITTLGPPHAVMAHSFGGGTVIAALADLPVRYHPKRMVLMASFSRATWIFRNFQYRLGLTEYAYQTLVANIERRARQRLTDFDVARRSSQLVRTQGMIVHDPDDTTTHYRNALRYHQYWPNSTLLPAPGAGHHLGTPTVTEYILAFLIEAKVLETALPPTQPLPPHHDLVRFFAGLEAGTVERPVRIP